MAERRTVITGVGPVSGLGLSHESFSSGLFKGEDAIGDITLFDPTPYGTERGVEVRDFDVADYVSSQQAYLDRSAELTFAAMHLAVADAELDVSSIAPDAAGLVLGSAWGCQDTAAMFFADVIEKGPRFAKPFLFPHTYANTVISLVAMEYGLKGFHMHFASGAVSGAQALVKAYDLVRSGRQDVVFAGGFESLSETRMASHALRGTLAGVGEGCMPFDKSGSGAILGEGAGVLVVEDLDHANSRGAGILGEITGAGIAGGIADAMRAAGAGTDGECVIASANGCGDLDRLELEGLLAIDSVAGGNVPVTALKAVLGETEGAAGALHTAAAVAMMQEDAIPGIPGLAGPADDSIDVVVGERREADIKRVLVNSLTTDGNAVCLAIEKHG